MKANTWKKTAAFVLALTLVSGAMPSNYGGLFKGGNVIVANADAPTSGDLGVEIGSGAGAITPADGNGEENGNDEIRRGVEFSIDSYDKLKLFLEYNDDSTGEGEFTAKLTADIQNQSASDMVTIHPQNIKTLDLNGHTIEFVSREPIVIEPGIELTLEDKDENKSGTIRGHGGEPIFANYGKLNIKGGKYLNSDSEPVIMGIGKTNISGGEFTGSIVGSAETINITAGTFYSELNKNYISPKSGYRIIESAESSEYNQTFEVFPVFETLPTFDNNNATLVVDRTTTQQLPFTLGAPLNGFTATYSLLNLENDSYTIELNDNTVPENIAAGQYQLYCIVKKGEEKLEPNRNLGTITIIEPHRIDIDDAQVTVTQNGATVTDLTKVVGEVTFTSVEPFKVTMGDNTYQAIEQNTDNKYSLTLNITDTATVEKVRVELEVNKAVTRGDQVVKSVTCNVTAPLWLSLVRVNESDNNSESSPYNNEPREWQKVEDFRAERMGKYRVYYCFYQGDDRPSHETQGIALPYTITVNGFIHRPVFKNDLTYDGGEKNLLFEAAEVAFGTVMYRLGESGDYSEGVTATNAGTYTVYYMVEAQSGENGWAGINGSDVVTINKANMIVNPPMVRENLKYTGDPQQLIVSPPTVVSGNVNPTIEYAVTNTDQVPNETDYSTELPKKTGVGNYKVWYKIDGDNNYNTYTGSVGVSIAPAEPTITLNSYLTYNGENQQLITSIDYPQGEGGTNLYLRIQSENDDSYLYNWIKYDGPVTLRAPELMAKNAGNYQVYYYNDRIEPSQTESGKLWGNCTIHKANLTAGDFTFMPQNPTYDGHPKQADVQFNGNDSERPNITVKYYSDSNRMNEVLQPTDAGTYYVGVTWAESDNYYESHQRVYDDSWQFRINKADPTLEMFYVDVPTDLTYDGSGKAVTVTPLVGGMGNAVVVYSTDNGTTWSKTLPKNAGEYRFGIMVEEGTNYTAQNTPLTNDDKKFTISKTNWEGIEAPQAVNGLVYNGFERVLFTESNLPDGADIQYKRIEDNQHISDVIAALNSDEGWNTEIPKQIDAKPYFFYIYRVAGDENHNVYPDSVDENDVTNFIIKAQIDKAEVSVDKDPTAINNLYFNGQPMALINAGRATGGTFEYSVQGNSTEIQWSSEIPERTEAGTYNVYWRVVGDSNHYGTDGTDHITVTINEDAEVTAVIDKIKDIGTVEFTTSCRDKIKEARRAYDALPSEKKNLISNYSTLTDAEKEYARLKAQYTPDVANASLTLGDDLGLNFYITGIDDASEYKVKFTGKCVQNGQTVDVVEKNGKFFATANVYAKDIDADITAVLYKGEEQVCEAKTTSVSKYLNSLIETPDSDIPNSENVKALAKATLAFGAASGDYFYSDVDHGFAAALANAGIDEAKILGTAKAQANMFNTPDTLISLVLDSNTAIRVYIKGVAAGTEASLNGGTITAKTSSSAKAAMGYDSYFEIEGLDPQQFGTVYKINVNGKDYEFTALSWANRVIRRYENDNASVAEKDVKMAKAVTAYYLAAKNIFSN